MPKRNKRAFRLKVLVNDLQGWLDRGVNMDLIHGPHEIGPAVYNRVGIYLLVMDGMTDCWSEFRYPDGSYVAVRVKGESSGVKYQIDLDRLDLPSTEARLLLKKVAMTGFNLGRDIRERMHLSECHDELRRVGREAALWRIGFDKRHGRGKHA